MHSLIRQSIHFTGTMLTVMLAAVAGGCGTAQTELPPVQAGLGCIDDSAHCQNQRRRALNALLADKERTWIGQPASAEAYASGVRLFAFKQRKRELNCSELATGQREAKAARATLRAAAARLSPAQIARGAMLGDEIAVELARESRRRKCKV